MNMDPIRVLLIVAPGAARDSFQEELAGLPVVVDVVEAVDQIEATLIDTPYNGIILDVPTLIRASGDQKRKSQILLEFYPVLRLSFRPHLKPSQGLTDGLSTSRTSTIGEFLSHDCARFKARPLRSCQRCPITLNVLVASSVDGLLNQGMKAYTVNVSLTGCFIATPEPPPVGSLIHALFTDFAQSVPVELEVCWNSPWGEAKRVPGFGARFTKLNENQNEALVDLLRETRWLS